jgi:hypothetical protein
LRYLIRINRDQQFQRVSKRNIVKRGQATEHDIEHAVRDRYFAMFFRPLGNAVLEQLEVQIYRFVNWDSL